MESLFCFGTCFYNIKGETQFIQCLCYFDFERENLIKIVNLVRGGKKSGIFLLGPALISCNLTEYTKTIFNYFLFHIVFYINWRSQWKERVYSKKNNTCLLCIKVSNKFDSINILIKSTVVQPKCSKQRPHLCLRKWSYFLCSSMCNFKQLSFPVVVSGEWKLFLTGESVCLRNVIKLKWDDIHKILQQMPVFTIFLHFIHRILLSLANQGNK